MLGSKAGKDKINALDLFIISKPNGLYIFHLKFLTTVVYYNVFSIKMYTVYLIINCCLQQSKEGSLNGMAMSRGLVVEWVVRESDEKITKKIDGSEYFRIAEGIEGSGWMS